MKVTTPLSEIKKLVQDARDVAQREAFKYYSCVRSRGAHVYCRIDGNNVYEAESYEWNGTKKDLQNAINYIIKTYPGKKAVFGIEGGFNGANSVQDLNDDCYDPWVSEWTVELFDGVVEESE